MVRDVFTKHLLLGIVCMIFMFGCKCSSDGTSIAKQYKDSVYLEIKGNDLNALFMEGKVDPQIYYPAVNRIRRFMMVKNDTICINLTNGAEVNISENIFDYYYSGIIQDNRRLINDTNYEIRKDTIDGGYNIVRKDLPDGFMGMKKIIY